MKLAIEDIKSVFKKFDLEIISEYINCETHVDCIDSYGYKYNYRYCDLKFKKNKCLKTFSSQNKFHMYNKQLYIERNVFNGTKLVLDNTNIKIDENIFKCGICGNYFIKKWLTFRDIKFKCCYDCMMKIKPTKKTKKEEILKLMSKNNYISLEKDEIINTHKFLVKNKEDYIGYTSLRDLRANQKFWKFHKSNPYTIYNINLFFQKNGINLKIISDKYEAGYKKLEVRCECSEIFKCSLDKIKAGKTKCNRCTKSQSIYEIKVENYLRSCNENYIFQYKIKDCRNILPLPFDFYLPRLKILLEVDGIGHYKPTRFNGMNLDFVTERYEKVLYNDEIKNKYCKENNIELIRLPYWVIDNKSYKKNFK